VSLIFINCIAEWVCVDISQNEGELRASYSYRIRWLNIVSVYCQVSQELS